MRPMNPYMSQLRKSFFAGLLVVLPVAASVLILVGLFNWVTNFLLPAVLEQEAWTPLYRVVALLGFLLVTTAVGWVTRLVVGKRMVRLAELVIERVPVLNRTYAFVKEISHTLLSGQKTMFQRVVLVQFPRQGLYSIGFVTSETGGEAQVKTKELVVNVFVPTTPNPTSGFLVLVPKGELIELNMSVGDGMKMVISGGAVVPGYPSAGAPALGVDAGDGR
jgi:uncharacterized membrane protein